MHLADVTRAGSLEGTAAFSPSQLWPLSRSAITIVIALLSGLVCIIPYPWGEVLI
jgi:hypothetical protein